MRKIIYSDFCYRSWCHGFISNINIEQKQIFSFNRILLLQILLAVSKALRGYLSLQHIENYSSSKIKYEDTNYKIMEIKPHRKSTRYGRRLWLKSWSHFS